MWRDDRRGMEMKREESVAGSFYPANEEAIMNYFRHFTELFDKHAKLPRLSPRAVIVPHAGYVYSGFTASIAYRLLQNSGLKKFVVIGPSHRIAFRGSSMCGFDAYATPLGDIESADDIFKAIEERFSLPCVLQAHGEHSTEVQFPFVKHFVEDASIVEIVYSDEDAHRLAKIIEYLLQREDCGVIISTDLSHFHTLQKANEIDSVCIKAIETLDMFLLSQGCEACGKIGVGAMILAAKRLGLSPTVLDYRTSADVSGDSDRVVGYVSAAFS